jgi:hypothetical protein
MPGLITFIMFLTLDTYNSQLNATHQDMKRTLFAQHSVDPSRMAHLNRAISVNELIDAFEKLHKMKAAGADGITAECFKAATAFPDKGSTTTHSTVHSTVVVLLLRLIF